MHSVASFFVSRVDTNIDAKLETIAKEQPEVASEALALRGKAAVANAKLAYRQFEEFFIGRAGRRLLPKVRVRSVHCGRAQAARTPPILT
jgi:transaldolase